MAPKWCAAVMFHHGFQRVKRGGLPSTVCDGTGGGKRPGSAHSFSTCCTLINQWEKRATGHETQGKNRKKQGDKTCLSKTGVRSKHKVEDGIYGGAKELVVH